MRRRVRREERDRLIFKLHAEGKGNKTIARELRVDVKTIRKVVRRTPRKRRAYPTSMLEAFQALITKLVVKDRLTAVRVLEEIRATGYKGGYSILKVFIRKIRPRPIQKPHLRFETEPGVQGQIDLSPYSVFIDDLLTDVVCFSFVLGYSRWQFIYFVLHADAHTVCHAHVLAFDAAGGIPHEILYDRMKQVVLESDKHGVLFHPLFERLVKHYAFRPVPLAPGYKEGKGKVENPFRYVEGNFLAGRRFTSLDDLNRQAARWLAEIAWVRIHRTTQEQPILRLERERPHLIPIPPSHFDAAVVVSRLVGDDFCVAWETNRYSVPPRFTGHTALARILEGGLEIEIDSEIVATHVIRSTRNQRYVLPEHEAAFRKSSTSRVVLEGQFLRLGGDAKAFAAGLVEERGGSAGYHMGKILEIAERVGGQRIQEALRRAMRYRAFDYHAIERIIAGKQPRRAQVRDPAGLEVQQLEKYLKGAGNHQRSLEDYRALQERGRPTNDPTDGEDTDTHGK